MKHLLTIAFLTIITVSTSLGQTAKEVMDTADKRLRGESSISQMTMRIVRPEWTREVSLTSWSKGNDMALILITAPVSEKGQATLKRDKEIWSWQPTIDRIIKLPPSMMSQSWMGSDFTNDDLVKESSVVDDYTQKFGQDSTIDGRACWKVFLTPTEEAAVVWGLVICFVDKQDYMQLRTEFYDEDGYLVNTMLGQEPKMLGGKLLPSKMVMIPAEEEGRRTEIIYHDLQFDVDLTDDKFSIQSMKRLR